VLQLSFELSEPLLLACSPVSQQLGMKRREVALNYLLVLEAQPVCELMQRNWIFPP